MKLAHLLLTILVNSLQNAPAAATASMRRLQLTAACANDEDSFYFNTTHTVGGVALGGCYGRESGGADSHDVRVFTLNGDGQNDGDLVFFATSSLTDDDDVLVWAVGVYATADDSHSKVCYDDDTNDVAEVHPSAVLSWYCSDGDSGEGEISTESSCNCTTPPPTPSPTSPSPTVSINPSPSPTSPSPTVSINPSPSPTSPSPTVSTNPSPSPTSPSPTVSINPSTPTPTSLPASTSAPIVNPPPTPQSSPTNIGDNSEVAASGEEEEEEPRWLDALWQIVVTVIAGAVAAAGAACGTFFWRRRSAQSGVAGFTSPAAQRNRHAL